MKFVPSESETPSVRLKATPALQSTIRARGLKQTWIAAHADMTPSHLNHAVHGRRSVSLREARVIALVVGGCISDLFEPSIDGRSLSKRMVSWR